MEATSGKIYVKSGVWRAGALDRRWGEEFNSRFERKSSKGTAFLNPRAHKKPQLALKNHFLWPLQMLALRCCLENQTRTMPFARHCIIIVFLWCVCWVSNLESVSASDCCINFSPSARVAEGIDSACRRAFNVQVCRAEWQSFYTRGIDF